MAFLRTVNPTDIGPVLHAQDVYLRTPALTDFPAWAELRAASREFLTPWEPVWPRDDLTKAAFRRRIRRYLRDMREDQAYPFFLYRGDDDALLGGVTLSNIRRGVAQACALGYWIGAPHARRGYMTQAVGAVIPFVFQTLRLHRLEAACLPSNSASIALLRRCGFTEEGYARRYLRINGVWQDHLLFALLAEDALV